MRVTEYNSRQRMTFIKRLLRVLAAALASAVHCFAAAPETTWAAPSARIAKEIAAISGPGTATLTIQNQSSIPDDELPTIQRDIEAQLQVNGIQIRSAENAATTITDHPVGKSAGLAVDRAGRAGK